MIGKFIGGLFGKVVDNAEGILDKVITTDKERDEAKLALKRLLLEAEKEAFAKEVDYRINLCAHCAKYCRDKTYLKFS